MSVLSSISRDLKQFIDATIGEESVHELGGEFLGTPYHSDNPFFDAIDAVVHGSDLFMSWLWFDYRYKKRSLLEHYCQSSKKISAGDRLLLRQMLDSLQFSLFQFGDIKPGNIECIDLRSGVHYRVREYALASQIQPGQIVLLRLCRQADHWEILMPNGSISPLTIDDDEYLEELLGSLPSSITIKDTFGYSQLLRDIGLVGQIDRPTDISLKDAANGLRQAMQASGIDRYISFEKIANMLKREYKSKDLPLSPPLGTRILLGLVDKDKSDVDILLSAASIYWNALGPAKKLKKATKRGRSYLPDLHIDRYYPSEWVAQADEAHALLTTNDPAGAIIVYDEMFASMHKKQLVTSSAYRLITNAAVAHLATGDLLLGIKLVREALRICPDYDFALKQQQLIDDGTYLAEALQNTAGNSAAELGLKLPDKETLRGLSDAKLIQRFSRQGVKVDAKQFAALAKKHISQSDVVEALGTPEDNFDYVYALLDEARDRWAPDVIWVDTIHEYTYRLEDAIYPTILSTKSSSVAVAADQLSNILTLADGRIVKSWMNDSQEYADNRQNFVFYCEDMVKKPSAHAALLKLCEVSHLRTKDPIFNVPLIIQQIQSSPDDNTPSRQAIKRQAKALPLDYVSMQIIGDCLSQTHPILAIFAFELGINALDLRVKKKVWSNPPYDYQPVGEHLDYIFDSLCELYEQQKQTTMLEALMNKYKQLTSDRRVYDNPVFKASDEALGRMETELFADNPVVQYITWFDSLGIDLSGGDGHQTQLTTQGGSKKIGRNEPCPCGSGSKYKKCHGSAV